MATVSFNATAREGTGKGAARTLRRQGQVPAVIYGHGREPLSLSLNARVIIMDEPTSSLTQKETDRLYEVIDGLKKAGVAVLYISHRLAEVKRVADRVTVLRDGKNAGELAREEINHEAMVRLMVGRDLKQFYPRRHLISEKVKPKTFGVIMRTTTPVVNG